MGVGRGEGERGGGGVVVGRGLEEGREGGRINYMCCNERNNLARCVADLGLMY